ncbi:hypothetical protein AWC38_SpisGene14732 [Stylophora pistillata]|uniref:Uncharacterized protein n=1 Tax=Stylophora pistillata TaxID=50429 RepID=A0A2B4RWV5_STYPI|nr:hypothetical protein AWC38_SpisGene14732 [Stylophora pistillata]
MASRFEIVDEEYIEELKDKSENENTRKSTEYWKNLFKKWANERNFQANLEEYESDVFDRTLEQFYAELRKENGDEYQPDFLKVMQASLERYLKSKALYFHVIGSYVHAIRSYLYSSVTVATMPVLMERAQKDGWINTQIQKGTLVKEDSQSKKSFKRLSSSQTKTTMAENSRCHNIKGEAQKHNQIFEQNLSDPSFLLRCKCKKTMSTFVFTSAWRQSSRLCHLSPTKLAATYFLSTKTSPETGSIFERISKEELAPKSKPRLQGREFLPGSTGGGFPEFLAEPSDSFPHGVRVNTGDQSSLSELGANCMEYIKKNLTDSQAILFRGLPAETADDFLALTQGMQGKPLNYEGGTAPRPKEI